MKRIYLYAHTAQMWMQSKARNGEFELCIVHNNSLLLSHVLSLEQQAGSIHLYMQYISYRDFHFTSIRMAFLSRTFIVHVIL